MKLPENYNGYACLRLLVDVYIIKDEHISWLDNNRLRCYLMKCCDNDGILEIYNKNEVPIMHFLYLEDKDIYMGNSSECKDIICKVIGLCNIDSMHTLEN